MEGERYDERDGLQQHHEQHAEDEEVQPGMASVVTSECPGRAIPASASRQVRGPTISLVNDVAVDGDGAEPVHYQRREIHSRPASKSPPAGCGTVHIGWRERTADAA